MILTFDFKKIALLVNKSKESPPPSQTLSSVQPAVDSLKGSSASTTTSGTTELYTC